MKIWSNEIKDLENLYKSLKGTLPGLEEELKRLILSDDENMLLVYSRRCLEVIITYLCEHELNRKRGTEPLQRIIDKLNKEETVPHNIIVSMHNVNSMSTFGAHPKEFELEQIKPVINNLTTIIKWFSKYTDNQTQGEPIVQKEPFSTTTVKRVKPRKKLVVISGLILASIVIILALIKYDIDPFAFSEKTEAGRSIAVLPLANLTGDINNEALISVLHDALIGEIAKLKSPQRVISRTSTLRFKEHGMLLKDIANELGVNTIVEGSVTKAEDSLGIIIQLIDVFPEEQHLLANEYYDHMRNVQNIQSAAVKDIAREIDLKLTKGEEKRLNQDRPINPETFQAYVRGMHSMSLSTPESFQEGINYFMEAINKDPGDPHAYAALALGYATKGHGVLDAEEAFRQAESAANTAISIDPTIDKAHTALAMLYLYDRWDWGKAKVAFEDAVIANSNNSEAHAHFAWYHMLYHDKEKSLYHAKEAALTNPMLASYKSWLAVLCLHFEEYEKAEEWALKTLELNENSSYANLVMARLHARKKSITKAREYYEKLPKWGYWKAIQVDGYVKTGQRDKAMEIWNEMEETAKSEEVNSCYRGMMAASLGFIDKAFEYFNDAVDNKIYPIPYLHVYGCAEYIIDDPRYNELRLKLKLPADKNLIALY